MRNQQLMETFLKFVRVEPKPKGFHLPTTCLGLSEQIYLCGILRIVTVVGSIRSDDIRKLEGGIPEI